MAQNSADSQAQPTGASSGAAIGIDHNHPLFLHASDDFKFKKKGGNNSAYNVTGEVDDGMNSSASTSSSDARDGHMRGDGEFKTQKQQLDSCALTREQYTQILQLLDKKSEVPHCVNAAGMNSTLIAASNKSSGWIIDPGATNHVMADLSLLKGHSICKVATPKKVHLPNGDKVVVTHLGSSTLDGNNTVSEVFYIPQF
ncbi:hypothetical protein KY285_001260 [Solanum tuberosum]|nr:hypothetical protein KY285_001260 [Solanum tuberosum]